jgi:hypothetical protein
VDLTSRFVQYRVELRTGPSGRAPELRAVSITHSSGLPATIGEHGG